MILFVYTVQHFPFNGQQNIYEFWSVQISGDLDN